MRSFQTRGRASALLLAALCGVGPLRAAPERVGPPSAAGASASSATSATSATSTQALKFSLPIRCTLGDDCFVQNHVDRDPGPGWRDYACGALAYDGHNGTDFRLRDLAQMQRGVEVLAAAPGRVVATRDGEPDLSLRERGRDAVAGREAGNAVRVDHGDGWETQYGHLRRGSVRVQRGQWVERGAPLGLVGLSGKTEFPHLHFTVRRQGQAIDPFDAAPANTEAAADCPTGPTEATVWREDAVQALRYIPTGVLVAGFAAGEVDRARVQRGEDLAAEVDASAPVLVFYGESFGVRAGDRERILIERPDGTTIARGERVIDRNLALRFGMAGRRANGPWPPGRYQGRYEIERAGRVVATARRELIIR